MAEETKQNPKPEQIRASEIDPIYLGNGDPALLSRPAGMRLDIQLPDVL